MRSNYWNLVWGIIGIVIIINSITSGNPGKSILGIEIHPWVYIAIWSFISILSLIAFFKRRKQESDN